MKLRALAEDLELRVKLLEARVRALSAQQRESPRSAAAKASQQARRARPRPRCPGCMLELPRGRRGESCVWCGFRFEAVKAFR